MAFWINNNEKATETWKWISETLKVLGLIIWILHFLVKTRDKPNNVVSDFQLVTQWIVVILLCSFLILNFIHWLKPIWFEKK
ncbi:MAG: hypothetical protein KGZ59_08740 [Chitinophagaceae bacterium]|nr:hypothetical protein [Chitinophagaceae bacterium]